MRKVNLENGIFCLPNGNWKVDKKYQNVRISFQRKSKQELIRDLKLKIKEIDNDIASEIIFSKKDEIITFDKLFDLYGKSRQWIPYTYHKQRLRFEKYFQEFINMPVKEITNNKIIQWTASIHELRNKGQFQDHYANKLLRIMKGMLTIAKTECYCSNKISLLNITYCKNSSGSMRSEKLENNYLTEQELNEMCEATLKLGEVEGSRINKEFFCFILKFLYYSGCRINEARAIKVKDITKTTERSVDGSKKNVFYILIQRQMEDNTNVLKNQLKCAGDSDRRMYIKKDVFEMFERYIKKFKLKDDDYLFDYFKNGMPLTRKTIADAINNILKTIKKNKYVDDSFPKYLTPHGLRYSNTLYLKKIGVSVEQAAKMQGHTVSVMLNFYSRVDKNEISNIFGF